MLHFTRQVILEKNGNTYLIVNYIFFTFNCKNSLCGRSHSEIQWSVLLQSIDRSRLMQHLPLKCIMIVFKIMVFICTISCTSM